jgi:hypothetical protein
LHFGAGCVMTLFWRTFPVCATTTRSATLLWYRTVSSTAPLVLLNMPQEPIFFDLSTWRQTTSWIGPGHASAVPLLTETKFDLRLISRK